MLLLLLLCISVFVCNDVRVICLDNNHRTIVLKLEPNADDDDVLLLLLLLLLLVISV
jgi:hypothetical protein